MIYLQCSNTKLAAILFSLFNWYENRQKNGTDISEIKSLNGRYEIHDKENNFIIRDTTVDDAGLYTCSIPALGESAQIDVVGKFNCLSLKKLFTRIHKRKKREN